MDKTPKSKFFDFRKTKNCERSSSSDSHSISKNEVIDLETLPISENVIPTSPAVARVSANQLVATQVSPQFIVGWNDGESNEIDMNSPIRSAPILRRIRRCPDSHTFKAPKNKSKDNKEDILQCIDWAKNLFESTSQEKEVLLTEDKKVTETRSTTKDINIDIPDDCADEIMVLCSQAIEESLPLTRNLSVSPVASKNREKHPITPEVDVCRTKRLRIDTPSKIHPKTIKETPKTDVITPCNNNTEKSAHSNESNGSASHHLPCPKEDVKSINYVATMASSKCPASSVLNQDLFQTLLNDDDDDLFGSFDFHAIDKLTNQNKKVPSKSVGSHSNITALKLNDNRNTTKPKYTKEQIEQRRLEAKKRLLFNRKYKSV